MKDTSIKRVELEGIHKRYDLDIEFNSSLNILHGQNGTGKSTLIHIIANIANCDFIRFAFLEFKKIKVTYFNNEYVTVKQIGSDGEKKVIIEAQTGKSFTFSKREAYETTREMEDERYIRELTPELAIKISDFVKENNIQKITTSYFPAFRTMLEAWSLQLEHSSSRIMRRHKESMSRQATVFSRNLFGQFLPIINYPSPIDIENNLRDEIRDCQIRIARYESSVFSDSFVKVFSALLQDSETTLNADDLLEEISQLTKESTANKLGGSEESSNTYKQLQDLVSQSSRSGDLQSSASGALSVYRDALKERQNFQQKAFKEVDTYFAVINSFLDKKELSYMLDEHRKVPKVGLKFPDNTWSNIRVMSSGERQLLTMLYAVNRMGGNSSVLIDEPEISLHIDWQEDLLKKMMEQLGDRQIIVCTHSPAIASDYRDYMKEILPIFNDTSMDSTDFLIDDEEDF